MRPTPTTSPEARPTDTAPLDEAEINRLIAASRAETYRSSETTRRAPTESFRPKSLLELARLRREAEAATALSAEDQARDAPEAEPAPSHPVDGDALAPEAGPDAVVGGLSPAANEAPATPAAPRQSAPAAPSRDAATRSADETDSRPSPDLGAKDLAAAPARAPGAAALPVDRPAVPDAQMLEQVRAEAYAAGRAAAEAEAHERLTAATATLEAAAQALMHPGADALSALRADITEAVLRLASERAGLEIDAVPDAFLERIEALAERIHGRATQAVLRLHPDDLAAIETLVRNSDSLSAMRIVASGELSRGDVELSVDGLRLSDRILGQPAPRKSTRAAPQTPPGTPDTP